jgi:hypothetical protein
MDIVAHAGHLHEQMQAFQGFDLLALTLSVLAPVVVGVMWAGRKVSRRRRARILP